MRPRKSPDVDRTPVCRIVSVMVRICNRKFISRQVSSLEVNPKALNERHKLGRYKPLASLNGKIDMALRTVLLAETKKLEIAVKSAFSNGESVPMR